METAHVVASVQAIRGLTTTRTTNAKHEPLTACVRHLGYFSTKFAGVKMTRVHEMIHPGGQRVSSRDKYGKQQQNGQNIDQEENERQRKKLTSSKGIF